VLPKLGDDLLRDGDDPATRSGLWRVLKQPPAVQLNKRARDHPGLKVEMGTAKARQLTPSQTCKRPQEHERVPLAGARWGEIGVEAGELGLDTYTDVRVLQRAK
jgi:hypothetical protein